MITQYCGIVDKEERRKVETIHFPEIKLGITTIGTTRKKCSICDLELVKP